MTNKRAAQVVQAVKFLLDDGQYTEEVEEALDLAIKALKRQIVQGDRPTLRHIIINHPTYGKRDGCYDEALNLIFHGWITKEVADKIGWKIEEVDHD